MPRWNRRSTEQLFGAMCIIAALLYIFTQLSITAGPMDSAPEERASRIELNEETLVSGLPDKLRRVSNEVEFETNGFFRFRLVPSGKWLAQSMHAAVPSRTVAVSSGRTSASRVIQSWSGYFLSTHRDGSVGFDRAEARGDEMWELRAADGETIALRSVSNRCFVRYVDGKLRCDVHSKSKASRWEVFAEPSTSMCRAPSFQSKVLWREALRACWADTNPPRTEVASDRFVVFGTPKPLRQLGPADPTNSHDPYTIANRTLVNWSLIDGVVPVVFTMDPLSKELIEQISRQNEARGIGRRIEVIEDFELQAEHQQPTYRGLFLRVMREFPDAHGYMYSNMDILYTQSLVDTLRAVRQYHAALLERHPMIDGWFVVGRRTNVEVPADWSLGENWERDIEETLRPSGVLFQSLSEDYFALSREMFDWAAIPDFIVGGTAFDNWVTTKAVRVAQAGRAVTVEATATLTAVHQNHGENVKASHEHPKSRYNNLLAHRNGGWALGHTTDAQFITVCPFKNNVVVVEKQGALV